MKDDTILREEMAAMIELVARMFASHPERAAYTNRWAKLELDTFKSGSPYVLQVFRDIRNRAADIVATQPR